MAENTLVLRSPKVDILDGSAVLVTRGGYVESRHRVTYALASSSGDVIASAGDIDEPVFMRSSAKPLICAAIVASGAAAKFGFTTQEVAIIAGSHSGQPHHVATVHDILAKIGLDESALGCGVHAPFHEPTAVAMAARCEQARAIHNNCSGKHAGILALTVYRGHSPEDYLSPQNPAQIEILNGCAALLGVSPKEMPLATDGCGVPVFAVSLRTAARCYARLGRPAEFEASWRSAVEPVVDAMIRYPEYVGGADRFDTDLMTAVPGSIICKSGAEGYHATCLVEKSTGLVVKIVDGNDRAVSPFVMRMLIDQGLLSNQQAANLERYRRPVILNHVRDTVGHIYPSSEVGGDNF